MATNHQLRNGVQLGYLCPSITAGVGSLTVTGNTWLALAFVPEFDAATKQVAKIQARCASLGGTGTLGANDLVLDLCADSSGAPNSAAPIESRDTVTATPTAAGWVEFTGFTAASTLTRGNRYHIVLKNLHATRTISYSYGLNNSAPLWIGSGNSNWGWSRVHTTDAGTTWTGTPTSNVMGGLRIEYTDGSFEGFPLYDHGTLSSSGESAYGTREVGFEFTLPSAATFDLRRVIMGVGKTGAPPNPVTAKIYGGAGAATLLGTSSGIPGANIGGTAYYNFPFSSSIIVPGGTILTVALATSGGDTSNFYRLSYGRISDDANTRALMPFGGWRLAYFNGASWSYDAAKIVCGAVVGDTETPFHGGGGPGRIMTPISGGLIYA